MVADMSYTTVSNVIDSWEEVRRLKDYELLTGVALFTKLFALEPEAMTIFGFDVNADVSEELSKSPRFTKHEIFHPDDRQSAWYAWPRY